MTIQILAGAEQDLLDGIRFYERRVADVARHFLESVLADIRSLNRFAGVHARHGGYYRMIAKRFPFAIFYRVKGDRILVHAVLDCRRDPAWIRRQLARKSRHNQP